MGKEKAATKVAKAQPETIKDLKKIQKSGSNTPKTEADEATAKAK